MAGHREAILADRHAPHNFEYATQAARLAASGLVAADVGRVARVLSDESRWALTDDSPVAWQLIGGRAKIQESILTGTATFVDLTVPVGFKHLMVTGKCSLSGGAANRVNARLQFNGDTAANYDSQYQIAVGNTAFQDGIVAAVSGYVGELPNAGGVPAGAGQFEIYIPDYLDTVFPKTCTSKFGGFYGGAKTDWTVGDTTTRWRSLAAITSIRIFPASGSFIIGSEFTLWGLA